MTTEVSTTMGSARAAGRRGNEASRWKLQDNVILAMWILLLIEPEWFLSAFGGGALLKRVPTLLLPVLLLCTASRWRREALYWPFVGIMAIHVIHMPFVENRGLLMAGFKSLYQFFFVFVGSACIIRSPSHTLRLATLFMLHFSWFAIQGAKSGQVSWHSMISNPDSFGPLMGIGLGYCYYYAQSIQDKRLKWIAYLTSAICIIGVISSLARGAVLSAALVMALVWLRSPRKLATLAAALAAAVIGLAAITAIFPENAFWKEMSTVSEGNKAGTGLERWVMWNIALDVFEERPLLGAGPNNVGALAFRIIPYDPQRPQYSDPSQLYNKKLHNIFLQILSEQGLIGSVIWLTMIADFFLRLRRLRRPEVVAYWRQATGNRLDVALLSLGLECAMVAFLANGFFYNQMYIHWFWTLTCMAYLFTINTQPPSRSPQTSPPRPSKRTTPGARPQSDVAGRETSSSSASLGSGLVRLGKPAERGRR